jgi:hypothetical protein
MDFFLNGDFLSYGRDVISYQMNPLAFMIDPMAIVFPKVAKCSFYLFYAESIIPVTTVCLLPMNAINDKLFALLWFWMIAVAAISGLQIIFRILLILLSEPLLRYCTKSSLWNKVAYICKNTNSGDQLMIYQLAKNLDNLIFDKFIVDLHESIETKLNEFVESKKCL